VAAFLDSEENFMIFRRFGYLQSRLILDKQDQLHRLEERLDAQDDEFEIKRPGAGRARDIPKGLAKQRGELLSEIEKTFCEYCKLLGLITV
jgi:hypothetical protein